MPTSQSYWERRLGNRMGHPAEHLAPDATAPFLLWSRTEYITPLPHENPSDVSIKGMEEKQVEPQLGPCHVQSRC